jgi:hypothetical protein
MPTKKQRRKHTYTLTYSKPDKQWLATVDTYPGLSWLDDTPITAIAGMILLAYQTDDEIAAEKAEAKK